MSIHIHAGMSPEALLACYEDKQIRVMKDGFKASFHNKCEEERQKLAQRKILFIAMTPDKVHKVLSLLEQCGTAFQVQALEVIVLEKYEIPDDFKEVEAKGAEIMDNALRTS